MQVVGMFVFEKFVCPLESTHGFIGFKSGAFPVRTWTPKVLDNTQVVIALTLYSEGSPAARSP